MDKRWSWQRRLRPGPHPVRAVPAVRRWDVQVKHRQRVPVVQRGDLQRCWGDCGGKLRCLHWPRDNYLLWHWRCQEVPHERNKCLLWAWQFFQGRGGFVMPNVPSRDVFRDGRADGVHHLPSGEVQRCRRNCHRKLFRLHCLCCMHCWHKLQALHQRHH